jgi:hypothetical protein
MCIRSAGIPVAHEPTIARDATNATTPDREFAAVAVRHVELCLIEGPISLDRVCRLDDTVSVRRESDHPRRRREFVTAAARVETLRSYGERYPGCRDVGRREVPLEKGEA